MTSLRSHSALVGLLGLAACDVDALDHEGRCPTRELPNAFDGEDLDLLKGYTRVGGSLVVPEGTTDLSALGCLEVVDGDLDIGGVKIETLEGLENLRRVGGLSLSGLRQLHSTAALAGLEEIGDGGFHMYKLESLQTIEAPTGLTRLGWVTTRELPALEHWDAPLGVTELSDVDLLWLPAGAHVGAFAEIERVETFTGWAEEHSNQQDNAVLRLDALVYADGLSLEHLGPESVASLQSLTDVGAIRITGLVSGDLTGLSSLRSAGSVWISDSPGVTSLSGLSQLETLSVLSLSDNPNLTDLDGLAAWRTTRTDPNRPSLPRIELVANPVLADVGGIAGIEVGDAPSFILRQLPALTQVPTWPSLDHLAYLWIEETGITDLDALSGVRTLSQGYFNSDGTYTDDQSSFSMDLERNPDLTDLSGLHGITSVVTNPAIAVLDNPALADCTLSSFLEALEQAGASDPYYQIEGNGEGATCE